jgi:hypothetical protein
VNGYSWGEEQIARLLERNGIAYQYEYPLAVVDRGKVRIYYPDFRLPEYSLVIEYFGVNGDGSYDEQARHKMEVYKRAGVDALFLTRDSLRGDWPARIMSRIESILKNRLDRFQWRRRPLDLPRQRGRGQAGMLAAGKGHARLGGTGLIGENSSRPASVFMYGRTAFPLV